MKILLALFFPILFYSYNAAATVGGRANYFILKEGGDTVEIYGEVTKDDWTVFYKDADGKTTKMAQSKMKRLVAGDDLYITLPVSNTLDRLQKVIATNNSYIMTYYDQRGGDMYIWDKHFVAKEKNLFCGVLNTGFGPSGPGKRLMKTIEKYFGSCKDLMDKLNSNLNDPHKHLTDNISNYKCTSKVNKEED
jgi:hypothetical protein